jgi:hypothetical protein
MTRKDYHRIAKALGQARAATSTTEGRCGVNAATEEMARALQRDNPLFKRQTFLKAVWDYTKDAEGQRDLSILEAPDLPGPLFGGESS